MSVDWARLVFLLLTVIGGLVASVLWSTIGWLSALIIVVVAVAAGLIVAVVVRKLCGGPLWSKDDTTLTLGLAICTGLLLAALAFWQDGPLGWGWRKGSLGSFLLLAVGVTLSVACLALLERKRQPKKRL